MRVKDVVGKAVAGQITWKEAERILGYSARHVRRLRERCRVDPGDDLGDRRAGRQMPKRVSEETVREILHLRQSRYFDFNVRHFHEKLVERHSMEVGYTYVKNLLQETGLAERAKARGKHRRRRERRPMRGMMLQMDGSPFAWLGPDKGERTLVSVIDDADGLVLYGQFFPEETTKACLAALEYVLTAYGVFSELYVDRASHFVFTRKASQGPEPGHTQVERVLRGLRIRPIFSRSPQGKGRIERSYRTQQGRLPQELREAGIGTWEEANAYLRSTFLPDYNRRFGVEPDSPESAFMPVVGLDVRRACALEHEATVRADNCIQWARRTWQVPAHTSRPSFARCKVVVVEYLDGAIDLEYGRLTIARFDSEGVLQREPRRGKAA